MEDGRIRIRIPLRLSIAIRTAHLFDLCQMSNLSTGGVFIETEHELPVDSELDIYLQLPEDTEIISAAGRVVWRKPQLLTAPPGLGIQFTRLQAAHREKIERFIREKIGQAVPCKAIAALSQPVPLGRAVMSAGEEKKLHDRE